MSTVRNIQKHADDEPMQHGLRTDDLDYALPERLIATRPIEARGGTRDMARMMVVSRSDPSFIEHRRVRDMPGYLRAGDALVFNTSAVARARLAGRRAGTGGRVEGLFLDERVEDGTWLVMLRSNGRLRAGDRIELIDAQDETTGIEIELRERSPDGGGEWIVAPQPPPPEEHGGAVALLERIGRTPLPPYILRARGSASDITDELDRKWYETVYADSSPDRRRSVAAPTAGLHFTPELLSRLDEQGVQRLQIILHVGAGTFKPVSAVTLAEHVMHLEQYEVPPDTLAAVAAIADRRAGGESAAADGPRIIAIGTTAVRTLESLPEPIPHTNKPLAGATDLMIAPPYAFRNVDGMLTNFHLPRSTLLALVAAMIGLDRVKALYQEAVQREYRFYSYGDCMLILP